jgi:ABC-type transporter Mla subunit MlaD
MDITTPLRVVVSGAGAAADRIDRILRSIEVLAVSIKAIEADMRGMRADLREVIEGVDELRTAVEALDGSVGGIRDATLSLDRRVVELGDTLVHVDTLARSLSRISRRGRTLRADERG